jgi:hypothetical protein
MIIMLLFKVIVQLIWINLIQVKLFNLDKSNFVMGQATMADANFCIDINIFPSDL